MSEIHEPTSAPPAPTPVDSGSQALAEALRSSFAIVRVVMVLLVAVFLGSGFFTVGPQEKALILRFGQPRGEGGKELLGAGLHWSFPYPIDEVVKVPIAEILTLRSTVGWYATTPEQELAGTEPPAGPSLNPGVDGYALTADGNIVHTRATLRYRIEDPVRCVFGFAGDTNRAYSLSGVSNAVLNALNNALLRAAAQFKVDEILTSDRIGFQDAVCRRFVERAAAQNLGVVVDLCTVESKAPRQLSKAFDDVVTAGQKRSTALNEAKSYENKVLSTAESEATAIVNTAEAQRWRYVGDLAAEAERFAGLLPNYRRNPELFLQQRLVETMGRVLTNVQDKIFLPERADGRARELRLLLNREPPKPKIETTPQP
jgi:membrane protease subunit HflK